jgi:pectinesterase
MKSKMNFDLKLAPIAFTLLATVHLAACGSSTKGGSGGATGAGGATTGAGGTTGGTDGGATDGGGTGGSAVPPGPCTIPTAITASGTDGLQAAGPAVTSTATRPQLLATAADALYTITTVLAAGGSVGASTPDNWDPVTNGIGNVATFVPMFTVALDGSGTHTSIQAAINDARLVTTTTCARIYILIKPGIYRGTIAVTNKTSAPPITLYGSDANAANTVIVFDNAASTIPTGGTAALGTSGSATFTQSSLSFQAKNLTFSNDFVEKGASNEQAVALLNQGDRAQFENVRALGNQDTLYLKSVNTATIARAYFRDSYVEGDTDFIFGRGTTVFDHCEIHTMGNSKVTGTATAAPSTEVTNPYGFLYISSKFTADANVAAGTTYFARQWYESSRPQAVGKMIVRNSTIGAHIMVAAPWQPWAGRTILAASPDGGAPDAGAATTPITTPLYTSTDYFSLIGGGPTPAEVYIAEYGNINAP